MCEPTSSDRGAFDKTYVYKQLLPSPPESNSHHIQPIACHNAYIPEMSNIFVAHDLTPYRNIRTAHEGKFSNFLAFVGRPDLAKSSDVMDKSAYAIQVGDDLTTFNIPTSLIHEGAASFSDQQRGSAIQTVLHVCRTVQWS